MTEITARATGRSSGRMRDEIQLTCRECGSQLTTTSPAKRVCFRLEHQH